MKVFCTFFIIAIINSTCYTQWVLQQSNTSQNLFGVYMIDANTGFVAGDNQTIRKTTNGGLNWSTMSCPNLNYGRISFLNATTGIIAGTGNLMIQTYNGGVNWVVRFPVDEPGKVQYIDSVNIYATGSYGVMKSTNGGLSWFYIDTSNYYLNFRSVYFINKDTGTSVGQHGLVKTTFNGGLSWTRRIVGLPVQFGDSTLYDVIYTSALTGYACGNNGIVIKTTNGGINWIYKPIGNLCSLPRIYFSDSNNGTVVGYPCIWRTTNGGDNWLTQPYPPNPSQEPLWGVYFVNSYLGWIVGFNGTILYTSNGGLTWTQPVSNEMPNIFKLEQNYPNPFNPSSVIKYAVPFESEVTIKVYDMQGQEVKTLVNQRLKAGLYEATFDGSGFASGVYFYTLNAQQNGKNSQTGNFSERKKMVLIK